MGRAPELARTPLLRRAPRARLWVTARVGAARARSGARKEERAGYLSLLEPLRLGAIWSEQVMERRHRCCRARRPAVSSSLRHCASRSAGLQAWRAPAAAQPVPRRAARFTSRLSSGVASTIGLHRAFGYALP